jgi:hypothetical protein
MDTVAPAAMPDGEPVVRCKSGVPFVAVWNINAQGERVQYWQCMYPSCPRNLHRHNLSRHVENKHSEHFRRFQRENEAIPLPDNWRQCLRCDPCNLNEVSGHTRNRAKGVAATQHEVVHTQLPASAEQPPTTPNSLVWFCSLVLLLSVLYLAHLLPQYLLSSSTCCLWHCLR